MFNGLHDFVHCDYSLVLSSSLRNFASKLSNTVQGAVHSGLKGLDHIDIYKVGNRQALLQVAFDLLECLKFCHLLLLLILVVLQQELRLDDRLLHDKFSSANVQVRLKLAMDNLVGADALVKVLLIQFLSGEHNVCDILAAVPVDLIFQKLAKGKLDFVLSSLNL